MAEQHSSCLSYYLITQCIPFHRYGISCDLPTTDNTNVPPGYNIFSLIKMQLLRWPNLVERVEEISFQLEKRWTGIISGSVVNIDRNSLGKSIKMQRLWWLGWVDRMENKDQVENRLIYIILASAVRVGLTKMQWSRWTKSLRGNGCARLDVEAIQNTFYLEKHWTRIISGSAVRVENPLI